MKAITCSQCGALIKRIRISDKFAECEYCHATIPIIKEKVVEIPDKKENPVKPVKPQPIPVKVFESYNDDEFESDPASVNPFVSALILIVAIGGVTVLVGFFILAGVFSKNNKPADPSETSKRQETIYQTPIPVETPVPTPEPTPLPDISYRAYVKYNTNIGAEHIEIPTIEAEQLPTFDIKELKKTVFKEKRIRVRIKINPDGEVTEANALNGHKALQESSRRAAKSSLFSTRQRESSTTLTYIYVLEE